tara:strand:+ start:342 stop:1544 length:1203 start_codon:yes stop_codon:yes gene_type:complete
MMNINKYLGLIIVCFLISNCSGDESSALIPEKALLVSPAENYPCLTGDSVSDTEIEVIFRWSPARYTDYYNLRITNLISNEVINKTNIKDNGATVVLEKGKAYSWSVSSKSDLVNDVGTSEVNNFYVGGFESVTNAPVPVSLTQPVQGSNVITGEGGKVSFSWSENSQNNSMKYTLYLDKIDGKQTPSSEHTDLTAKSIDVTLENGSTYFWRVKSFDGTNSSFSAVNTFKTNATDSGTESNTGSGTNSSQEQVKEVSGNLIKNGTFETGSISPWGGFKNAVLSSSIQQPNSGEYLARIEPGDGSLYQIIYLQPGEVYKLKFSAKWKDIPDRRISVKLKNEEGDKAVFLEYEIFESTDWVEYDIEFTAPEGVNIARLLFYKSQTNPILPSLFLDDFVIQKK